MKGLWIENGGLMNGSNNHRGISVVFLIGCGWVKCRKLQRIMMHLLCLFLLPVCLTGFLRS